MANTTNYNWETPDDTDLVKDGAAAIRTLGSSVDTTTKALNPSTTLGDIEYRSATANTNTRLGIGTTGQVLTVAGGVPTWATSDDANAIQNALLTTTGDTIYASGASTPARLGIGSTGQVLTVAGGVPSWATPASGGTPGLVLIHTETFSSQTSVSVNSKFSATYDNYVVRFNNVTASANTSINMRMRASGTDETSSNYKAQYLETYGTTVAGSRTTTATSFTTITYINTTYMGAHIFELVNPFNTVVTSGATIQPNTSAGNIEGYMTSFGLNTTTSYDGLTVFTNSGSMTGSFSIYGYAK